MLNVSPENLPQKRSPRRYGDGRGTKVLDAVFHTLAYADIFDYPLTDPEVYRYLTSLEASREEVARVLRDGTWFTQVDEYFTLRDREQIVETRMRRAKTSARLWHSALRYGEILARLPFVRMVAVTGSLAMNNADEGNDVDYMLVTVPNRLWTCRLLSLAVARLAKLEGINLCPNYLVTTNALELKERSLYVAHELVQMIPLSGMEVYRELRRLNRWTEDYLPNADPEPEFRYSLKPLQKQSKLQRFLEVIFGLPFANWLETWEMKRKIARLTREQSSSLESHFSADVCKGHVDRHGENVVTAFAVRVQKVTKVATTKAT